MKFGVKKDKVNLNSAQFMRLAGYTFIRDRKFDKESYVRKTTRNNYPRFHIYIQEDEKTIFFDLHLDQKQASYPGAHAHNAEYDGEVVESEISRLKNLIIESIR